MWQIRNKHASQGSKFFDDTLENGCGPSCSSVNERDLLCPTCKLWVWHSSCLILRFQERKLEVPDFTKKKWKCIHCYGRSQRRTYL